jgi:hypothetical protein
MLTPLTLLILAKSKSSLALLALTLLNYATAERARQFELTRELGTLACQIENRRLLNKDSSALQRKYDELAKLRSK